MKRFIYILSFALAVVFAGCDDVGREELFTTVAVELQMPEGVECCRVQATLRLQERNTGQVFETSSFEGAVVKMRVLKGYYYIEIDGGVMTYVQGGATKVGQIVHTTDNTAVFMGDGQSRTLAIQIIAPK